MPQIHENGMVTMTGEEFYELQLAVIASRSDLWVKKLETAALMAIDYIRNPDNYPNKEVFKHEFDEVIGHDFEAALKAIKGVE